MAIKEYTTRALPYVFALVILGLVTGISISQAFVNDQNHDPAVYLSLTFGGFWIMLAASFAKGYRKFTIYQDRFVVGPILYSDDIEVRFTDIEHWNVKRTIKTNPSPGAEAHEGKRNSKLILHLKDGSVAEMDMDDFINWEEIREVLRERI